MSVLFVLLLLTILVLLWRQAMLGKHLQTLRDTLSDLRAGNLNRRFLVHTQQRNIQQLTSDLNQVLDKFQQTVEWAQYLEESRKKMMSNISHDLRTPLTSMLGYVEALQQDDLLTEEERERFLSIIANKGHHLSKLFHQFFELAKLESDDALLKLQRVNMTDKVQEVLVTFYQEVVAEGLTPELSLPDEPLHVWGDPGFIERILNNLISNALRYGRDGGVIGITVEPAGDDEVRVDVWDRGAGIEEQDLPYVFERLYTGAKSRNAHFQGSGIGLTITKQLIEKQKGTITVFSEPGVRTSFSFRLPRSS